MDKLSEQYEIWKHLPKDQQCEYEMKYSKYPYSSYLSYNPKIVVLTFVLIIMFAICSSILLGQFFNSL